MFAETFVSLLKDINHWLFECVGLVVFDGLLLGLAIPFFRRWLRRHDERVHGINE